MATYQAAYDPDSREVLIQEDDAGVPAGSVDIGSFHHPDVVYPDSVVIYHAVRDLLYKVSHANPSETAMFPDNITDMHNIDIVYDDGLFPEYDVTPVDPNNPPDDDDGDGDGGDDEPDGDDGDP